MKVMLGTGPKSRCLDSRIRMACAVKTSTGWVILQTLAALLSRYTTSSSCGFAPEPRCCEETYPRPW